MAHIAVEPPTKRSLTTRKDRCFEAIIYWTEARASFRELNMPKDHGRGSRPVLRLFRGQWFPTKDDNNDPRPDLLLHTLTYVPRFHVWSVH